MSGVLDRPLTTYAVPHRPTLSQAEVDEALVPVLRLDAAVNQAVLTARIAPLIRELVTINDDEREYLERLQWGEFVPELVAKDQSELLEGLRRHPGLLWKAENGRRRQRPSS